jgi:hypothetical protein
VKRQRKNSKTRRTYYRFSLIEDKERDMEVMKFLNSIPKPLRGELIIEGLMLLKETFNPKWHHQKEEQKGESPKEFKGTFEI